MFSTHTTTVVNGGRQIRMDLDYVITKSFVKPPKNWKSIDESFFTSSENLSTKKPSKFLESHDISKKTLWVLFRGFKEPFSGTLQKISDFRAFSLYVTVPGNLIRRVDNRTILQARRIFQLKKEQDNFLESLNNSEEASNIPTKFERTLISVEIMWTILTAGHFVVLRGRY